MTMEITETKEAVTKAPFSAWVGNLHAYTEGKTEGRWIDFPQSKENLQKAINDISKNGAHEIFIADYDFRDDCTYLNNIFSEYSSISKLNVIAKLIGSEQHPAVEAYLSQDDGVSLKQLANLYMQESEIPYHTFSFEGSDNPDVMKQLSDEGKIGYELVEAYDIKEQLKGITVNEVDISQYIDIEAIGRDAIMDGFECCDGGYYISNEKSVNTDYYTMEEIEEELDEMEPAQNAEVEKTVDVEKEQKEHLLRTHPEPALRQPRL